MPGAGPEGRFVCLHFANEEIWGFEKLSYSLRHPGLTGMKTRWKTEAPQAPCTCQQVDLEWGCRFGSPAPGWTRMAEGGCGVPSVPRNSAPLASPGERESAQRKDSICPGDRNVLAKPVYPGGGGGTQLPLSASTDKGPERPGRAPPGASSWTSQMGH